MRLKGVCLPRKKAFKSSEATSVGDMDDDLVLPSEEIVPWPTLRVMAACHALAITAPSGDRKRRNKTSSMPTIAGDPLEQAVLNHTGYRLAGSNIVVLENADFVGPQASKTINIHHRFAFSSKMKRMTVLVTEDGSQGVLWALTKGAPETIKEYLTKESIPDDYDNVSFHHMSRGRRVLAMAYREAGSIKLLQKLKASGRDEIERDLTFAGFLVLDCPLKPDSKSVIAELKKSGHGVVMITGDALLTAAEVARQCGIVKKSTASKPRIVYQIQERSDFKIKSDVLAGFECTPLVTREIGANTLKLSSSERNSLRKLAEAGDAFFCLSGDVLVDIASAAVKVSHGPIAEFALDEKHILMHPAAQVILAELVPMVSVFARHAPHQKEAVVAAFNRSGFRTLMCGDGTNDVGALKRADVGISIISAPGVEMKQREASVTISRSRAEQKRGKKSGKKSQESSSLEDALLKLREAQEELDYVELGDASVAAPFTSRAISIKCCKDIIQQGRCTLVTMLSIYKILGINCLVNALVLSKLFLHGVKQGDRQLTALGLAVAALFYFVTRAQPLPTLSVIRPPSSVLCAQALLSISVQFVVHCAAILLVTEAAMSFVDPFDPSLVPDGPFNPNVLNSATFLMTCVATLNTFAVNYRGKSIVSPTPVPRVRKFYLTQFDL